jgi:hypothetical protein
MSFARKKKIISRTFQISGTLIVNVASTLQKNIFVICGSKLNIYVPASGMPFTY